MYTSDYDILQATSYMYIQATYDNVYIQYVSELVKLYAYQWPSYAQ